MKNIKIKASLNNYGKPARKIREVVDVIRGNVVEEAEIKLKTLKKQSAEDILNLLKSAVANAENNYKLLKENLFISEIKVNDGTALKRWRARAYGRAGRILKRSCKVDIVLEEIFIEKKKKDSKEEKLAEKKEIGKKIKKISAKKGVKKKEEDGQKKGDNK